MSMRLTYPTGLALAAAVVALVLGVKGCGSDGPTDSGNTPPVPAIMDPLTGAPPQGSSGQLIRPVLSWTCSDSDGDPLVYDVYLGTGSPPPLISADRITSCFVAGPLDYNTTYFWYVVAKDNHGNQSRSEIWSFRTRPEPLMCSASASQTIGPPPLVIDFTGEGFEGLPPYTYFWVFGDDSSSTAQHPTHEYLMPGVYSATLKVTDLELATCSKMLSITVEGPPACSGYAVPSVGPPPLTVALIGTATGGKSPYTFLWDFGDGDSSTLQNPIHTIVHPGDHTIWFEVTGADGRVCETPVRVTVGPLLSCDGSASPVSGPLPLTVRFSAFAAGGRSPYTYQWTFGDGTSSSAQNPVHTYNRSGPFTAVLTVGDSGSSTCSKSLRIVAGI